MARKYSNFLSFTQLFALIVIVLGAYTRLADAGLGCPDWPGCYGQLLVPDDASGSGFERPLEPAKAWAEMIHRYVAGTLGILILIAFILAFKREIRPRVGIILPFVLLCTVVFQAALGMWTVTKLLSPVIVTAHLIGGFTTLSLLWVLWLQSRRDPKVKYPAINISGGMKALGLAALLAVIIQIVLGGWVSTNYAALACGTSFPTCHGSLWPADADFEQGFSLEQQMQEGVDYEFGILESPARTATHITHRAGAVVVLLLVGLLGMLLFKAKRDAFGGLAKVMLILLAVQLTLGVLNIVMALPIAIATAHNLVAALLLLMLLAINYRFIVGR